MKLKRIPDSFSICKLEDLSNISLEGKFSFLATTDEEISLVCLTKDVPNRTLKREDGWIAFRIQGELDFSLVGILAKIATLLANQQISIFAISTFNTDYVLVREAQWPQAIECLHSAGYIME